MQSKFMMKGRSWRAAAGVDKDTVRSRVHCFQYNKSVTWGEVYSGGSERMHPGIRINERMPCVKTGSPARADYRNRKQIPKYLFANTSISEYQNILSALCSTLL